MAPASWITCLAPVISTATSTPRGYISRMVRERSSTSWTRATAKGIFERMTGTAGARNDIKGFNCFRDAQTNPNLSSEMSSPDSGHPTFLI